MLSQWRGTDATAAFVEAMHPSDLWADMKQMAVAYVQHCDDERQTQAAQYKQHADDLAAQSVTTPQPTAATATPTAATSTTKTSNGQPSHSASQPASIGSTPVRCLIVHGSQTGTATSQ